MLSEIFIQLMKSSEIITNLLDLAAFILAAPEIIGKERIQVAQERLEGLEQSVLRSRLLFIFFLSATSIVLIAAIAFLFAATYKIFEYNTFLGIVAATTLFSGLVYIAWIYMVLKVFQSMDQRDGSYTNVIAFLYIAVNRISFFWKKFVTPRGMLYVALVIFFISRLLAIAHSLLVA